MTKIKVLVSTKDLDEPDWKGDVLETFAILGRALTAEYSTPVFEGNWAEAVYLVVEDYAQDFLDLVNGLTIYQAEVVV